MSLLGIAAGGIAAATDRFQRSAERIARAGTGLPGSEGDLTRDLVDEGADEQALKASVTVARTADQMTGTILDIVA